MFCPVCGHEVNDDAKFCPICGTRFDSIDNPDEDPEVKKFRKMKEEYENQGKQKIYCSYCRKPVVPMGGICPDCGRDLIIPAGDHESGRFEKYAVPDSREPRPYFGDDDFNKRPAAKRVSIVPRLFLFIILLIAIAAAFFFFRK